MKSHKDSYPQLNWIFRAPKKYFYSIENIFTSLRPYVLKKLSIQDVFVPHRRVTITNLLRNINFVRQNIGKIQHVTGDVNYILPFTRGKKILTLHDCNSLLTGPVMNRLIKKMFWLRLPIHSADVVHCISESTKSEISLLFPRWSHKYHVIPNPIDMDFFEFPIIDKKKNQVLLIGTKSNKNIINSLNALQGLGLEIIIVGKETEELLQHPNQKYSRIEELTSKQLMHYIAESVLMLFPSTYEGFGLPILEAQALGTCVITSNISPMREVSGEGALLVDPLNAEEIKQNICSVMENPTLQAILIDKGKKNAKKYHPEVIAESYFLMYQNLLHV